MSWTFSDDCVKSGVMPAGRGAVTLLCIWGILLACEYTCEPFSAWLGIQAMKLVEAIRRASVNGGNGKET